MIKVEHISNVLGLAVTRLAFSYLAIIMLMSLSFSAVIYNISDHELSRQLPKQSIRFESPVIGFDDQSTLSVHDYFLQRIQEARSALVHRLFWLNLVTLLGGAVVSYLLAVQALKPIEEAMEAQGRFVSDASHELRTPLTAIQTSNEVALRRPKLTIADARSLIASNVEEVIKLRQLSDGLLGLARQEKLQLEITSIDVQDIVSSAINQIVSFASSKKVSVEDTVPNFRVKGDKAALVQVLVILLDNAIKYSPTKSTITMSARKRGKHAYVSIKDNGIGITSRDLPHIFDRFFRASTARSKGHQEGYGLGLSIAHGIMQQHHGDLLAESTPGKGSTFSIKIPLA